MRFNVNSVADKLWHLHGSSRFTKLERLHGSLCLLLVVVAEIFTLAFLYAIEKASLGLVIIPEVNHLTKLVPHRDHLLCAVHMAVAAEVVRGTLEGVGCFKLESARCNFLDTLSTESALYRLHVQQETEQIC